GSEDASRATASRSDGRVEQRSPTRPRSAANKSPPVSAMLILRLEEPAELADLLLQLATPAPEPDEGDEEREPHRPVAGEEVGEVGHISASRTWRLVISPPPAPGGSSISASYTWRLVNLRLPHLEARQAASPATSRRSRATSSASRAVRTRRAIS